MSTLSSSLVANLSEIYNKECIGCKERKIREVCDFIWLKNNKLYCKCNECKKRQLKPTNGLIKKFRFHICTNFVMKTLIKLLCY